MAASRSPNEFMKRHGITTAAPPVVARMAPSDLLANFLEARPTNETLVGYEGVPTNDRGSLRPWPEGPGDEEEA